MKRPFLKKRQRIYLPFKRFFDIFFSLLIIIIFCWLYLILAILVKCSSKGPILFKQKRFGKYKKLFNIYKFRTMYIDAPANAPTHMLHDPEKYITKIGKFLRKTSLDEIPQFFNILFGQMSFIGPRPHLWNQEDIIVERDKYHANDIVPGLSGYAQVHGRDTLPIPEKAKLDGYYVKHFGLWLDTKIAFITFFQVLVGKDEVEGDTSIKSNNSDENK